MFIIKLYTNNENIGYLSGSNLLDKTQLMTEAKQYSTLNEAVKDMSYILSKTDLDDSNFNYKIIKLELVATKEYIPKSIDSHNIDFYENNLL